MKNVAIALTLVVQFILLEAAGEKNKSANFVRCENTFASLIEHEHAILTQTQKLRGNEPELIKRTAPSLACILKIQETAEGHVQFLANRFLNPLLGDQLPAQIPKDKTYSTYASALANGSAREPINDPAFLPGRYARGAWSFYQGFCRPEFQAYCADFLPPENLVRRQSPLLGASSLMLLRHAYMATTGDSRAAIGARLKQLHATIPEDDKLKRRTIEEIYKELFTPLTIDLFG